MIVEITDADDDRVSDYVDLTDVALRRRLEPAAGLYMAESGNVIRRAVAAGHQPRSFLMAARWLPSMREIIAAAPGCHDDLDGGPVPVFLAKEELLREITGYNVHRGALAAMHRPQLPDPRELLEQARGGSGARRVAVLDGLVDHTNVGACFRSAAAMGVDAILVTSSCADPLYRRSVRVSMGTVFQVPWTRIDNWPTGAEELKDAGYVVAGMTLGKDTITLDELVAENHEKLALVFGAEGHGITPATDRKLDRRVTIPMMGGVDSLNVAAASAVAFYATRHEVPAGSRGLTTDPRPTGTSSE